MRKWNADDWIALIFVSSMCGVFLIVIIGAFIMAAIEALT
jgi:hypothetical protein